jgi:cupin 2 domain-containing protein
MTDGRREHTRLRLSTGSLLRGRIPQGTEPELTETILKTAGTLLERIVSAGHSTPPGQWYDQESDEWVALLQGSATLSFETEETLRLEQGDWVYLPAHLKHRVEQTSTGPPCIWIALYLGP